VANRANSSLGASAEQREAFMNYVHAFSNAEFDKFSRYYTDDVVCDLNGRVLDGKQAIVDFYREMFTMIREHLTIHQLIVDNAGIFADATARFSAFADASQFAAMPLEKDQVVEARIFIIYDLRDGKIARIRVARATASPE
jgi:ketosteroid isomerase-like protein